jgi:hypothetical protein
VIVYDFNPNNIPDEYLQAIGLVIASSSQTEEIMGHFLGALLTVDEVETVALHTHMSMPMKTDIIKAILELNAPSASAVDDVDDLLDRICAAVERRNEVAHNKFAIHPQTGEIFSLRIKARGSLQSELKPVTADDLRSVASEIYHAGLALQDYMTQNGLSPRSRERPLRQQFKRKKSARNARRGKFGIKY